MNRVKQGVVNHLTTCLHMFCDTCTQVRPVKDQCLLCKAVCSYTILNKDLPTDMKALFRDPYDHLKEFQRIYSFQSFHRKKWLEHCKQWYHSYEIGLRKLKEAREEEKKVDLEMAAMQREFTYLKSLVAKYEQNAVNESHHNITVPSTPSNISFGQRISVYDNSKKTEYRNPNTMSSNGTFASNSTLNASMRPNFTNSSTKNTRFSPYHSLQEPPRPQSANLPMTNQRFGPSSSGAPHMVCQRPIHSLLDVSRSSNFSKPSTIDSPFQNQLKELSINRNHNFNSLLQTNNTTSRRDQINQHRSSKSTSGLSDKSSIRMHCRSPGRASSRPPSNSSYMQTNNINTSVYPPSNRSQIGAQIKTRTDGLEMRTPQSALFNRLAAGSTYSNNRSPSTSSRISDRCPNRPIIEQLDRSHNNASNHTYADEISRRNNNERHWRQHSNRYPFSKNNNVVHQRISASPLLISQE